MWKRIKRKSWQEVARSVRSVGVCGGKKARKVLPVLRRRYTIAFCTLSMRQKHKRASVAWSAGANIARVLKLVKSNITIKPVMPDGPTTFHTHGREAPLDTHYCPPPLDPYTHTHPIHCFKSVHSPSHPSTHRTQLSTHSMSNPVVVMTPSSYKHYPWQINTV